MRRKLLFGVVLVVLLCSSLVVSVEAASMWSRTYGGTGDDEADSLVVTPDGGYAMAGYTTSFGAGGKDAWLVRTDAAGKAYWAKTYGGTEDDAADSLVVTPDRGYLIAGYTRSFGAEPPDLWLIKTDELGNMEWNRTYGGIIPGGVTSLIATSDGGYAMASVTYYDSNGIVTPSNTNLWLGKIDALGNMLWSKSYGGTSSDTARSLVATADGGYTLAGSTSSFGAGDSDFWLVKTDALGNMEWNRTYGGTGKELAWSMVAAFDGGYALVGDWNYSGNRYCWLVKTDSNGVMQWNRTYGGTNYNTATALVAASDGGYAIASNINGDFGLTKTDSNGAMQWNRTYGGTKYDYPTSLVATSGDGYALAGWTNSFGAGGSDFWLVKTDEFGIVPEYSSLLVPALVLTTTAFILINKKRLLRKHSQEP